MISTVINLGDVRMKILLFVILLLSGCSTMPDESCGSDEARASEHSSAASADPAPIVIYERNLEFGGQNRSIVILQERTQGTGIFYSLGTDSRGEARTNTVFLGDRVSLLGMRVERSMLILSLLVAGENDPMCCPTTERIQSYGLSASGFQLISSVERPFSAESLDGSKWQLSAQSATQFQPTLEFDSGHVAGVGGCNRYSANVDIHTNFEVRIGPIASTKILCPPPLDKLESTFLSQLEKAQSLSFNGVDMLIVYGGAEENPVLRLSPLVE